MAGRVPIDESSDLNKYMQMSASDQQIYIEFACQIRLCVLPAIKFAVYITYMFYMYVYICMFTCTCCKPAWGLAARSAPMHMAALPQWLS